MHIQLSNFTGAFPRTGPTTLEQNAAQVAKNVKLQSGEMRPWRDSVLEYSPITAGVKTIYKFENTSGDTIWLTWNSDVDVVPGPVSDLTEKRLYYTGEAITPRKTNRSMASSGAAPYPNSYYEMGTPAPVAAPTLTLSEPIKSIDVTAGGSGYTSAPSVAFSGGGGSGAAATAVLDAKVNTVSVTAGGSGYTSAPTVVMKNGGGSGAAATAVLNATVSTITIAAGGTGYLTAPTVSFSGGSGSGAAATATVTAGVVTAITITNAGTGYTEPPVISITGGSGSGAQATATISGVVSSITVTEQGSGYTSAPTVSFLGGGGTGATATAAITGSVASITLTAGGSGYSSSPTISFSGGGGSGAAATPNFSPAETRAYIYTYVTQFGSVLEESAPSPATLVTCSTSGATVTVSGFSSPPAGNYNFVYKRIYRSVTGSASTNYEFVAELAIGATSYADSLAVTALGNALTSLYFTPPPSTLQGLVSMPNGILAGFTGNQIWFCEPYLPHAWPSIYMVTVDYPVVGLGVFGSTLVVCTTRNPYLIDGTTPGAMSQQKLSIPQPCVSKRSIASDQFGVLYASPNGLVGIGPGTQDVVSNKLYTRDEWQQLNPPTMRGAIYNNMYIGFYGVGSSTRAVVIMRGDNPPLVEIDNRGDAVFVDQSTSEMFYVDALDNQIYQMDADPINNKVYEWKSKLFVLPSPMCFGAMRVQADFEYINDIGAYQQLLAEVEQQNQIIYASYTQLGTLNLNPLPSPFAVDGSPLIPIPSRADSRYVNVVIYADGKVVFTGRVASQEALRLPGGFKAYTWEILFSGNAPMRSFELATTMSELKEI